ncbi:GNAT family N-acetyltransferase [Sorangium sp. So ce394]|uniref:GNAT family N-acetyltransferase n=1 Tax=Sorangium sp. So ce394 TaxID=3133310 RepID=UPI003F5B0106
MGLEDVKTLVLVGAQVDPDERPRSKARVELAGRFQQGPPERWVRVRTGIVRSWLMALLSILRALEEQALALGRTRLVLETGVRQPEAIALYRRAGFVEIPPFGEYLGSPLSVCMGKDLPGPR